MLKIKIDIKKYSKIFLILLFIFASVFILLQLTGKYILPSFLVGQDSIISTSTQIEKLLDKKAPYFDLSDNLGGRIKLSQYTNTPVVVVFWATWNQESADQIKIIDDFIANQKQSDLVKVIAINSQEDESVAKSFIRRGGYKVLFALDKTGITSSSYDIKSLPSTFFIDKSGIIREIYTGILSEKMIVDKIENILNK